MDFDTTKLIIDYAPDKLYQIGKSRGWFTETDLYLIGLGNQTASKIDRTRTLNYGIKTTLIDEIPSGTTDKTFEEICDQEATKLIGENKPLAVYWSGGIDSTLALVSLLKQQPQNLTVVMTGKSIAEYPLFYHRYIKDRVSIRRIGASVFDDVDPSELIVTGELSDQLMGEEAVREGSTSLVTWQQYVAYKYGNLYVDIMTPQVKTAPFKIVSDFDFIWWQNFSLKWQNVLLRLGSNCADPAAYRKNVRHFYRSADFQRWAMNEDNHRTEKIKNTPGSYKHSMKKIIGDWTLDRDYQANKLKTPSLPVRLSRPYLFKLSDGTVVEFGTDSTSPDDYDKKYGNQYDHLFVLNNIKY